MLWAAQWLGGGEGKGRGKHIKEVEAMVVALRWLAPKISASLVSKRGGTSGQSASSLCSSVL